MATLSTYRGVWTVTVDADEPATFECSLDGADFEPCLATATFPGLGSGWHTVSARATDAAGNTDATPVEVTVKLVGAGNPHSSGYQLP
jgi:large repetitive protein